MNQRARKQQRYVVALTAAIVLGLTGVFLLRENSDGPNQHIVLPAVADQTGPIGVYGKWAVDGIRMAIDDVNGAGGVDGSELRLLLEDGQSQPRVGVTVCQRFASARRSPLIIAATNTGTVMACAPIANENKVVLFTPIASGPNISEAGPFVFRNRVSGYYEASEMARIAAEELGLKRIAQLALNNDAGPGYLKSFETAFEQRGGTVTTGMLLDPGKTDFRAQVLKVRETKPQAVFLALTVREAATFIKQSEELGFRPKWLSMTTIQSQELFKIAGDAAEGLIFVAEGGDEDNPKYRDFAKRYEQRFGSRPSANALNGYDAVRILAPLLAEAEGDGRRLRKGLLAIEAHEGVGGELSFKEDGDARKPLTVMTVRSGKFVSWRPSP